MGITEACLHLLIRNRMAGANISERHPLTGFHYQSPRSCFAHAVNCTVGSIPPVPIRPGMCSLRTKYVRPAHRAS